MSDQNRRTDFRIMLGVPLKGGLRIVGVHNKQVETNSGVIAIADISAGGVRIHTQLDLPMNANLLLEFKFRLFGKDVKLIGTVMRKRKLNAKLIEYGIRFSMDENESRALRGQLQMLDVRLKQSPMITSCSFCSDDEMREFYSETDT